MPRRYSARPVATACPGPGPARTACRKSPAQSPTSPAPPPNAACPNRPVPAAGQSSSSNNPPLNQAIRSNPNRPPWRIARNRSRAKPGKSAGARRDSSTSVLNNPSGQQPDVLGEQAEQQPGHEMRDRLRRMTALAQALRQTAQQRRGGLRHCLPRPGRLQPLRFQKRPAQEIQPGGIGQIVQRQPMGGVDRVSGKLV